MHQHINEQAAVVVAKLDAANIRLPVKVYCDIDDTLYPNLLDSSFLVSLLVPRYCCCCDISYVRSPVCPDLYVFVCCTVGHSVPGGRRSPVLATVHRWDTQVDIRVQYDVIPISLFRLS